MNSDQPLRVLVVLAHPDDPEFYCGGTVARWVSEGREVTYCLLTRGDKGDDDVETDPEQLAQKRMAEQREAAKVLGVTEVIFLDHPDGYLTPDLTLRRDVVRVIRQVRPEIIVTCDPTNFFPSDRYINHSDHRAAGQATLDAVFPAAGSGLYFPELLQEEGLHPHKVEQVYVAGAQHPNTIVNVTKFFDRKLSALKEHASQIPNIEALEKNLRERMLDTDSPPDAPRYIERFMRIDLRR
ncbi:MAG: PIG-L family deacetylase [Anaerolineaceae bacterium]|nr:MAG: PIG-L family deacetylase [Anaerolineaceae bacterium]